MKIHIQKIAALLLLFAARLGVSAQGNDHDPQATTIEFRFQPGEDIFYTPWGGNDAQINRIYSHNHLEGKDYRYRYSRLTMFIQNGIYKQK